MLGEFGVIVVCSGWLGGRVERDPGRSARGRYSAEGPSGSLEHELIISGVDLRAPSRCQVGQVREELRPQLIASLLAFLVASAGDIRKPFLGREQQELHLRDCVSRQLPGG